MLLSRCCKKEIWVYSGNEGTSFYVCNCCDRACDTIESKDMGRESHNEHDARHVSKT